MSYPLFPGPSNQSSLASATANLSLNPTYNKSNGSLPATPQPSRGPQERFPDAPSVHTDPYSPHAHGNQQESSGRQQAVKDAWVDQSHHPLLVGQVSFRPIPVYGGSKMSLSGVNFREGVEVVFECPQLGKSVEPKVVRPRIFRSTEMELTSPNMLDWWVHANSLRPCKELALSVKLICAGAKNDENIDTSFEISAVDDSEVELLHGIIRLHRLVLQVSLSGQDVDPETERTTKQKTLKLLSLEQPPNVTPAEHLALGVMYMLCDLNDRFSTEGMDILLAKTQDGHDMLNLAVLQGQTTLVREITRHLFVKYQTQALTSESELLSRDFNGLTAIDFAKTLGHQEIEQVLVSNSEAALDIRALQTSKRPLPTLPARKRTETVPDSAHAVSSPHAIVPPIPGPTLGRPLPPTPVSSPPNEIESDPHRPMSFYPPVSGAGTGKGDSLATIASASKQRIQTVQAIVEDHPVPDTSNLIYETPPPYSSEYPGATSSSEKQQHLHYPSTSQSYSPGSYSPNLHSIPPPQTSTPGPESGSQTPDTPFRPLPTTPHQSAAPLPPPKHKVTPVNRPKQFTIPSQGGERPEDPPTVSSPSAPFGGAPLPIMSSHFHPAHSHSQPLYPPPSMPPPPMSMSMSMAPPMPPPGSMAPPMAPPISMPHHDIHAYHHSMPVPLPQFPVAMPYHQAPVPYHHLHHSAPVFPHPHPHLPMMPLQMAPLAREDPTSQEDGFKVHV